MLHLLNAVSKVYDLEDTFWARFQVLSALLENIPVNWDVTPCKWVMCTATDFSEEISTSIFRVFLNHSENGGTEWKETLVS